eukprot:jgi/Antlo1/1406/1372
MKALKNTRPITNCVICMYVMVFLNFVGIRSVARQ